MNPKKLSHIVSTLVLISVPTSGAYSLSTMSGDLPRRAELGFSATQQEGRLAIRRVQEDSPAQLAGVTVGDVVVAIAGQPLHDPLSGRDRLRRALGGEQLSLTIDRSGTQVDANFTPTPRALEQIDGVDSHYGVVEMDDGSRLRSIVTVPEGVTRPLPAIFFTQWVSCGSIEYNPRSTSLQILATLARESGFALIRVERSSDGDSTGPACHELDYDTELDHYRQAFEHLVEDPKIDSGQVVILGSSLGSTVAPLLAQQILQRGGRVAGIAVQGGGAVTYLERMIAFDRAYLERRLEVDPRTIHTQMYDRTRFHLAYLVDGRMPDDIAKDSEAMATVRGDVRGLGKTEHYGRPFAWHQQAALHNFLSAWVDVPAPVLVIFNEFDQFESRHGHRLIVEMVNRLRPGTATWIEQSRTGHSNELFPTIEGAYAGEFGLPVPEMISYQLLTWLRETFESAAP